MESLVYGGPYVVDFTPPELEEGGGVWDGVGRDVDYQSSATLQADWSDIIDPESGVEECAFMIGENNNVIREDESLVNRLQWN